MKQKLNNKIGLTAVSLLLITLVILFSTNPKDIPVGLLIAPPVLVFTSLTLLAYQFLGLIRNFRERPKIRRLSYAAICASVPVLLLVLKSINQLSTKDIILMGSLLVLLTFYFSRFSLKSSRE